MTVPTQAVQSLSQIQSDLKERSVTCIQLVKRYLDKIKQSHKLNVFLEVYEEEALKNAVNVDQKIKKGNAGKMAGL